MQTPQKGDLTIVCANEPYLDTINLLGQLSIHGFASIITLGESITPASRNLRFLPQKRCRCAERSEASLFEEKSLPEWTHTE
jgi:hypothetical protein